MRPPTRAVFVKVFPRQMLYCSSLNMKSSQAYECLSPIALLTDLMWDLIALHISYCCRCGSHPRAHRVTQPLIAIRGATVAARQAANLTQYEPTRQQKHVPRASYPVPPFCVSLCRVADTSSIMFTAISTRVHVQVSNVASTTLKLWCPWCFATSRPPRRVISVASVKAALQGVPKVAIGNFKQPQGSYKFRAKLTRVHALVAGAVKKPHAHSQEQVQGVRFMASFRLPRRQSWSPSRITVSQEMGR